MAVYKQVIRDASGKITGVRVTTDPARMPASHPGSTLHAAWKADQLKAQAITKRVSDTPATSAGEENVRSDITELAAGAAREVIKDVPTPVLRGFQDLTAGMRTEEQERALDQELKPARPGEDWLEDYPRRGKKTD